VTDEAELIALFEDRYVGEVPDDAKAGIVALCQAVDGHPATIEQLAGAASGERRGTGDAPDDFLNTWVAERRDLTSAELR
jgi:hypothetical protein